MRVEPLGETALILRGLDRPAYQVANSLAKQALPGFVEAVAAYDTVAIYFEGEPASLAELESALDSPEIDESPRIHQIPVCYGLGDDLPDVCAKLTLSPEELQVLHSGQLYDCFAVGFCPGFPYLGRLPERLSGLPRKPSPRVRVEPGSVAITGSQTGIYPLVRPGGWWLIGRTPLIIVDVADNYFPIRAGDRIQFVPIAEERYIELQGERL